MRADRLQPGRTRAGRWLVAADILAFVLALLLALSALMIFRQHRIGGDFSYWWRVEGALQVATFCALLLWCLLRFWALGHYRLRLPFWDELRGVIAVLVGAVLAQVLMVVLLQGSWSRFLWPLAWLLIVVLLPALRAALRAVLRRAGYWQQPVVMLGCGPNAAAAWAALASEPALGFELRQCVQLSPDAPAAGLPAATVSLQAGQVKSWLALQGPVQLLIALEPAEYAQHAQLLDQLTTQRSDVWLVPPLNGLPLVGLNPQHFLRHDVLILGLGANLESRPRRMLKRGFDLVASLLALLLLSPLLVLLALCIRLDGGPALFAQSRIGRGGKPFQCLKFRTMQPDAEQRMQLLLQQDAQASAEWQSNRKLRQDPRITRLGAFLRRSSLDELPQLWNVVRGEMSLVGPRPIVAEELACYGDKADLYRLVRPGLTGLWQVSGRSDTSYAERVALDAWYIRNWSLWYDIAIVCKTVVVLWRRQGAY